MLETIKSLIMEKKEYQEASKILFEDATLDNIEDLIIIHEAKDDDESLPAMNDKAVDEPDTNDSPSGEAEIVNADDKADDEKDDDLDLTDPTDIGNNGDVSSNSEISQLSNDLFFNGNNKGISPANNDDIDDIMQVSVDLRSNTVADTAVDNPPTNSDPNDILNQDLDDGTDGMGGNMDTTSNASGEMPSDDGTEDNNPLKNALESMSDVDLDEEDSFMGEISYHTNNDSSMGITEFEHDLDDMSIDDFFAEEISFGSDGSDAPAAAQAPPDAGMANQGEMNSVTAAVKDKVAEIGTEKQQQAQSSGEGETVDAATREELTFNPNGSDSAEVPDENTPPAEEPPVDDPDNNNSSNMTSDSALSDYSTPSEGGGPGGGDAKELMNKLSDLTKNIEDIKKDLMNKV